MKKKIWFLAGVAAVVLTCVAGLVVFMSGKEDSYRVIKVLSYTGEPVISREKAGELQAYEGMVLESGDNIELNADSTMVILMDDDKYAYAEDNTKFRIVAEGTVESSKTKIELIRGTITCDVQNKLGSQSSYEVTTPNSTIAIRGTTVTVICKEGRLWALTGNSDGQGQEYDSYDLITSVTMWSGEVTFNLIQPDGSMGTENTLLSEGEQALIGSDTAQTGIISKGNDELPPETWQMGLRTLENLLSIQSSGTKLETQDVITAIQDAKTEVGTYQIDYFVNSDNGYMKFATQTVNEGEILILPILVPRSTGKWNVAEGSVGNPISNDLIIYWQD